MEGEGDDLIHVVVMIGGEAADETGVRLGGGGGAVLFVLGAGIGGRIG